MDKCKTWRVALRATAATRECGPPLVTGQAANLARTGKLKTI